MKKKLTQMLSNLKKTMMKKLIKNKFQGSKLMKLTPLKNSSKIFPRQKNGHKKYQKVKETQEVL
jgi:hypothetical protein